MGSSQSIPSTSEITDAPFNVSRVKEYTASTKNGPKSKSMDQTYPISITIEEESVMDSDASVVSTESDYSSDEEEVDEFLAERRMILEEARQLREIAGFYYHPEAPVASNLAACTRCFFSRYSAPASDPNELEDEAERMLVLADAKKLKELAVWHMHPEKPVVSSDALAFGRNYFTRPSAPEHEENMEEECKLILEEMKQLKTTAEWYMHPEAPVVSEATACARNFFSRPSAPVNESEEERELILEETKQLKTTAEWYMHPEKPVSVDAAACGRNFFTRPSAPEYEDEEDDLDERDRILEEMKQLKTIAEWYMHPEKPVSVDAAACGRNFFARPSAPEYEEEDMDERERVMEDMNALKMTAEWYLHPEKPVTVDSTACGRNYFSRSLTIDDDAGCVSWGHPTRGLQLSLDFQSNFTEDMEEERERIMEDMNTLKKTAEWYLQPEKPIAVDSTACGRNYFSRPSTIDDDAGSVSWGHPTRGMQLSLDFQSNYTEEMEEERKLVLAEANQLKEAASWYLQPEKPIAVDSTLFGRNYFSRPSAPEQEDEEDIEERELILAEINELKLLADWYRNPHKEVTVYATSCGRNFFSRPSAPFEDEEDADERTEILADAAELLKVAKWYMHPEKPVTVYATSCGRNFFSRPSVPEEDAEERERILAEAKQLKEVAGWYANPHQPVKSDSVATARNFFTRPSAPEYEEDTEERDQILAEAKELKKVAGWYANPEQPVKSDSIATARNFFSRPSAPEYEEDTEERDQILAEAKELKKVAGWYLEPEKPIAVDSTSYGRNFFTRPSAEQATKEDEEEISRILSDALELKKLAVDYYHPEKPIESSSVNCARNYFNRPSATGHADHIHSEGYCNQSNIHSDYVQEGYGYDGEYDQHDHYDHHHHHGDDVSHQSFQSHGDHFDMDEELHGFRDSITAFHNSVTAEHHHIPIIKEEDGKEGNLSRSPSSIMLFDEQAAV